MADSSTVARPYAKAVFDLAKPSGKLGEWSQALSAAAQVVDEPKAKRILKSPDFRAEQRVDFIASVCEQIQGVEQLRQPEGQNLLRLLAENDRLDALPEISRQFDALKSKAESKISVTLTSATEIDDAMAARVATSLEKKLGLTVELERRVDAALLGGAIVRADDMVIDASVKSRLQKLADALIN